MADNLTNTNKPGFMTRIKKYFKECKAEVKKVTWPDKETLIHNTAIIIAFVLMVTVILSVLDFAFIKLFSLLTNVL